MTMGQLVMYHNLGIELKYGKAGGDEDVSGFAGMSDKEKQDAIRAAREAMSMDPDERERRNDAVKDKFRDQYGDI